MVHTESRSRHSLRNLFHVNDSFVFNKQLCMSIEITPSLRFSCLTVLVQHHASYFQMQQSVSS